MVIRGEQLVAEGWCRRFSAAGDRLNLGVESFEEMGHEVCLLDVADDVPVTDEGQECSHCSMGDISGLKVIFSRKLK
ncbi:MAG: hypothetical protein U9P37_07715 [Pseudomonadota bacterium]|nr:hypothetical protein [Pseudomonadota bacterium]